MFALNSCNVLTVFDIKLAGTTCCRQSSGGGGDETDVQHQQRAAWSSLPVTGTARAEKARGGGNNTAEGLGFTAHSVSLPLPRAQ